MNQLIFDYFFSAMHRITWGWWIGLLVFAAVTVLFTRHLIRRGAPRNRTVVTACFCIYLMLVLTSTVFSRHGRDSYMYLLIPFHTFASMAQGDQGVMIQCGCNVLMFIPVGMMTHYLLRRPPEAIAFGIGCSLLIELLQLVMKKGYFEFDDIFYNTIGVAVGWLLFALIRRLWRKRCKKD